MTPARYQAALAAVRLNGSTLHRYKEQTEELCLAAIKQNSYALAHVAQQTETLCLAAVQQDGRALKFVRQQTEKICLAAIKQEEFSYIQVDRNICTEQFIEDAIRTNWRVLSYIHSPSEKLCLLAYEQDVRALGILWPQYREEVNDNDEVVNDYLSELTVIATQRELEWKLHQAHATSDTVNTAPSRRRRDVF